ncbi:MAG: glycosyltransferase family 4 protein [Treponema sp.]|jgi:glycosyltransferase involved in cell wall biosynthesis|nr:glycosyltransferase family 4 protein [Treponema sp.]
MIDSSGVGVYLRGILPFFFKTGNDFILLGNTEKLRLFSSYANVIIIECNVKPFSPRELFFFPRKIKQKLNKADVYFSPFFNFPSVSIPVFSVIHDIIFPDMPELVSKSGLFMRMWFYRRAFKKSHKIFTVSEFTKSRIKHHLGKERDIIVTHSAVPSMFIDYRAKLSNVLKTKTIVFVGNIKKHKGLDCLLDAFTLIKNEGLPHKLIIIGEKTNFRTVDNSVLKKIEALGNDTVNFTGFISNEKLMKYLAEAELLVQPSLYEGFGLPPLEAMILGTHVLISDIPVFKEIYDGFPVTFFRTGDSFDLKENILKLLHNKALEPLHLPDCLVYKYNFQKTSSTILQNIKSAVS